MAFVKVASADAVWSGEARGFDVGGTKILLVNLDGTVHAFEDRCAHQGVPLSEGSLQGGVLTCGAHLWEYDACTGQGVNPASARLNAFPVRVDKGEIWVDVDAADAPAVRCSEPAVGRRDESVTE